MKIVYLSNDIYGQGGIAHVLSVKTSLLIHKYGHQVAIISSSSSSDKTFYSFDTSIEIKQLPLSKRFSVGLLIYFKKLKEQIYQLNPDCVVICDNGLKGYLTCFLKLNVPIIFECHSIDFIPFTRTRNIGFGLKRFFLKGLVKASLKRVDKIVMLSKSQANFLRVKSAEIIPNPVWTNPKNKASLQAEKVVAIGRLIKSKGFERMIRIWDKIQPAYSSWTLDIYGAGSQKKELEKLIKKLNLESSVFLKGSVKNIERVIDQYAFLIHTSSYESFSLVIQEAMSFGLPAIAFDCPVGPKEIICHKKDGFLVEDGNNDAFVQKIKLLIDDVDYRQWMGSNAYEAAQRFNLDKIMNTWNVLFLSLDENYPKVK